MDDKEFKTFCRELGGRLRNKRQRAGLTQEDMIGFGFSARHWQQIEAGRPITLKTLLRACLALETTPSAVLRGLDKGLSPVVSTRARARPARKR